MFPSHGGTEPTAEQILELDREYLEGDVTGYFSTRIDSLIAWHDSPGGVDFSAGLGKQVADLLGVPPGGLSDTTARERELQVAVDAFAVRQHVAETLVRFLEARLALIDAEPGSKSLWFAIATGPTSTKAAVDAVKAGLTRQDRQTFAELMLPAVLRTHPRANATAINKALTLANEWINHACILLTREDLPLGAGHNKSKHGMAIRSADDERVTIVTGPVPDDGTVPLSLLDGSDGRSFDVVDRPVMKVLTARPTARTAAYNKGSEIVWILLDAPSLLAEASVLNEVLRAAVHVAAAELKARTGVPERRVPYPDLSTLPSVSAVLRGRSFAGLRLPVTEPARQAAVLGHREGREVRLNVSGQERPAVVVDDRADSPEAEA